MSTGLPSEDLLSAVHLNRLEAVREALARGADPNFTRTGYSPLLMAVEAGNVEMLKTLLDHGANADQANVTGWRPIHAAAAAGQLDMLAPLAEKMILPQMGDEDGVDALRAAVDARREPVVVALLAMGFTPNRLDKKGLSPLAVAVMNQDEGIVARLDEAGANWDRAADDGLTPRARLGDWVAGKRWADTATHAPAISAATGSAAAAGEPEASPSTGSLPAETGALGLSKVRRRNSL